MSCDNLAFDRNLRRTYKLLFLTKTIGCRSGKKNWSRSSFRSNPCKKLGFWNYFAYLYLNNFYITLDGKSLAVKRCSRFETSILDT